MLILFTDIVFSRFISFLVIFLVFWVSMIFSRWNMMLFLLRMISRSWTLSMAMMLLMMRLMVFAMLRMMFLLIVFCNCLVSFFMLFLTRIASCMLSFVSTPLAMSSLLLFRYWGALSLMFDPLFTLISYFPLSISLLLITIILFIIPIIIFCIILLRFLLKSLEF